MKRLAIACIFVLLGCAVGPRYHFSEGPPRLKVKAPRMANTNQTFLIKGVIEGDPDLIPFGDLIGVEIQANDMLISPRSAYTLDSRYITIRTMLSPDFYRQFSIRNPRQDPFDYESVDPMSGFPIEGEPDDTTVTVNLKISIVLLEIDYKNELVPVRILFKAEHHLQLSCTDMLCAPY